MNKERDVIGEVIAEDNARPIHPAVAEYAVSILHTATSDGERVAELELLNKELWRQNEALLSEIRFMQENPETYLRRLAHAKSALEPERAKPSGDYLASMFPDQFTHVDADMDAQVQSFKCQTCKDSGVVSTTDKDHNGDHIEQRCPDCAACVEGCIVIGDGNTTNHRDCIVIGSGLTTTDHHQLVIGSSEACHRQGLTAPVAAELRSLLAKITITNSDIPEPVETVPEMRGTTMIGTSGLTIARIDIKAPAESAGAGRVDERAARVPDAVFKDEFQTWWEDRDQFARTAGVDYERAFAFQAWRHLYPMLMQARAALNAGSAVPDSFLSRAVTHYEAALQAAFPSGSSGQVFSQWNEARRLIAAPTAKKEG